MKMLPVIYKELEGKRDLAFSLFLFDNASINNQLRSLSTIHG